jgi:hypothetical protein
VLLSRLRLPRISTGEHPVTTDPRDPAFVEPTHETCQACLGEGFVDVGEHVETCFHCNGEGVNEL